MQFVSVGLKLVLVHDLLMVELLPYNTPALLIDGD